LSIKNDIVAKICNESQGANENDEDQQNALTKAPMERVLIFCIYLLDKVVMENDFSWEDIMVSSLDLFLSFRLISLFFFLDSDCFYVLIKETGQCVLCAIIPVPFL
jgi:hypothetical protein